MCDTSIELKDVMTVGISITALTFSYFNFKRDSAHLLLHASIGKVVSLMYPTLPEEVALSVSITNDRRRSVIVKGIGFDKSSLLIRILNKIAPEKFKTTSIWWAPQGPQSQLSILMFEPDHINSLASKPRKYSEGDSVNIAIPLTREEHMTAVRQLFLEAKTMYVEDTTGVKYYLPSRYLKKIVFDLTHPSSMSATART